MVNSKQSGDGPDLKGEQTKKYTTCCGKLDVLHPSILLVGNPNSGKTTLLNSLTGSSYKVANYPGVTVEKKKGIYRSRTLSGITVVDLPGIYSLSGNSLDEKIAVSEINRGINNGSLIVAVVDASNLERNLFLVSELLDSGARLIVALNMTDIAAKDGLNIKGLLLSRELGVPVVPITARKTASLTPLKKEIDRLLSPSQEHPARPARFKWAKDEPGLTALAKVPAETPALEDASRIAAARYRWIKTVISRAVSREHFRGNQIQARLDSLLLHPFYGAVAFAAIMLLLFQAVFSWAAYPMNFIDSRVQILGNAVSQIMPPGILQSLLVDGIIAGVGSVIIFLPQIAILFFFIGLLEQSGYLYRAAVLMDRFFQPLGMHGRSTIPLLSSFACAVPGIMSARTIPSHSDRLATILVAPLMSCSARLPVYTVLIGAFIPNRHVVWGLLSLQGLTLFGLYLLGISGAAGMAWFLKITLLRGEISVFAMELPRFKAPDFKRIGLEIWERLRIFLKNAGTVILACTIILWFLAYFPTERGKQAPIEESYAGQIGHLIEPAVKPLGYDWKIGISLVASFAAREVFVSSMATVYHLSDANENSNLESLQNVLKAKTGDADALTLPAALSLLVFYVFACQCISTLAVCKRETGGWRWPLFMFSYMTALAYCGAFLTYRVCSYLF